MGHLVQDPLARLVQGPVRLQPSRVADAPHSTRQRAKSQLGSCCIRRRNRRAEQLPDPSRPATLGGKPNLIARSAAAVIVDAKTGQGPSHAVKVMIYLYAVPMALERYKKSEAQGAGHVPGPYSPHSGGSRRRPVRPEPRHTHPPRLGRRTREASTVAARVPVLRRHVRRLSRTRGPGLRARRHHRRFLSPHSGHCMP